MKTLPAPVWLLLLLAAVVASAVLLTSRTAAALQCHVGTITFYPGGGIKSCEIEATHQFWTARGDRLRCRDGGVVTQHPNGAVASCLIAEPHTIGGAPCAAPGRIELNADGSLRRCG